jgi:hypothetical protein
MSGKVLDAIAKREASKKPKPAPKADKPKADKDAEPA